MEDIPGLVSCQLCGRSGPGVDELIALPDELEGEALSAGWEFNNGWVCPRCLVRDQSY
jgi:hypothetical protein